MAALNISSVPNILWVAPTDVRSGGGDTYEHILEQHGHRELAESKRTLPNACPADSAPGWFTANAALVRLGNTSLFSEEDFPLWCRALVLFHRAGHFFCFPLDLFSFSFSSLERFEHVRAHFQPPSDIWTIHLSYPESSKSSFIRFSWIPKPAVGVLLSSDVSLLSPSSIHYHFLK